MASDVEGLLLCLTLPQSCVYNWEYCLIVMLWGKKNATGRTGWTNENWKLGLKIKSMCLLSQAMAGRSSRESFTSKIKGLNSKAAFTVKTENISAAPRYLWQQRQAEDLGKLWPFHFIWPSKIFIPELLHKTLAWTSDTWLLAQCWQSLL